MSPITAYLHFGNYVHVFKKLKDKFPIFIRKLVAKKKVSFQNNFKWNCIMITIIVNYQLLLPTCCFM